VSGFAAARRRDLEIAGIAGIASSDRERQIEQALDAISHRGQAGKSVRSHSGATFGEIWPAAQERYTQDVDASAVALDGEIHNWTELALGAISPREAIESCYQTLGPNAVSKLDGPFALAVADPGGVLLARDVIGKSPLYWGRSGESLCFASEIKGLLSWADEVREFPPGHYYHPTTGLVKFAEIRKRPALELPPEQVESELRARLVSSVRKRTLASDVGVWLSGGVDSAAMAALASRQMPTLESFVAGLEEAPDVEYARAVADFIGSRHHERVCSLEEMVSALPEVIYHLESFDALLVRSSALNFLVGQLASDYVPAVLSGEGGDELFAGYDYLKELDAAELADELVDITKRLHNTALQRVDRCSAGHGIVARTAFLDREVVEYALRIPAEMKLPADPDKAEKWILREAMAGLLPDEVLSRPKAKFWAGSGVGDLLATHAEGMISDSEFTSERTVSEDLVLNTKEELLYYRIFKEQFGDSVDPGLVGRTKNAPVA